MYYVCSTTCCCLNVNKSPHGGLSSCKWSFIIHKSSKKDKIVMDSETPVSKVVLLMKTGKYIHKYVRHKDEHLSRKPFMSDALILDYLTTMSLHILSTVKWAYYSYLFLEYDCIILMTFNQWLANPVCHKKLNFLWWRALDSWIWSIYLRISMTLHGSFTTRNVNCFRRKYRFQKQQLQGGQRGQRPTEDPQTDDRGEAEGATLQRKSFHH